MNGSFGPLRRAVAAIFAASLLLVLLIPGSASAAVAFTSTIFNTSTSNCVTVPGGATTPALQLTQAACAQSFTLTPVGSSADAYTITTPGGANCVDVYGASTANNAQIIQWPCNNQNNQRFQLRPVG